MKELAVRQRGLFESKHEIWASWKINTVVNFTKNSDVNTINQIDFR